MGTYTTFRFNAVLKQDAPKEVLDFIRFRMKDNPGHCNIGLDDHPFFLCQRWHWVLTYFKCDGYTPTGYCIDTDQGLEIHIGTRLKNYCNSVEWFLMWIAPIVNLEYCCTMYKAVEGEYYVPDKEEDCSELIRSIQQQVILNPTQIREALFVNHEYIQDD